MKLSKYEQLKPQIDPYIKKYQKAIKELQKLKIDIARDNSILIKYGLGQTNSYHNFEWSKELKDLDKQIK